MAKKVIYQASRSFLPRLSFPQMIATCILLFIIFSLPRLSVYSQEVIQSESNNQTSASAETFPQIPVQTNSAEFPEITATAIYVIDPVSQVVLHQQNANDQLPPASTTKLMTALIAAETYSLNQVITITQEDRSIGQSMRLVSGEQILVRDLIAGILINSGNDAAVALALNYPETGYSGFIQAMNNRARELGLENTNFRNVSGVGSLNHYSSARDLALLTMEAMKHPVISQFVSTQQMFVSSIDGAVQHYLYSTNQLLGEVEGVVGVKTGWTEVAGECLISWVARDEGELLIVILGSQDRFGETRQIIDWVYDHHAWTDPRLI